jgi:hypothetical protein
MNSLVESNPQLFRELKSRLKPGYITMSVVISLAGQILSLMVFGSGLYEPTPQQWQNFFFSIFMWFSGVGIFALLVVGTYLLISDLSKEEEKGTLNIIRLSPQSAKNILIGKFMGVPILLYLVAVVAIPLHLFSGLRGGISLTVILGFYAVLISSCIFFYSLAALYGLLSIFKGNAKAGLFSLLLAIALVTIGNLMSNDFFTAASPSNWMGCFNPWIFIQISIIAPQKWVSDPQMVNLIWYNLQIEKSLIATTIFLIFNYSVWTFWVWQGLKRWFHNPTTNLFTKAQSYWLTASWQLMILGFVINFQPNRNYDLSWGNFSILMVFNIVLYFVLIGALTPHRQTIQDWSRYRHYYKFGSKGKLWQDLVLGEKSPGIVAIAINTILGSLIWLPLILSSSNSTFVIPSLATMVAAIAITLIYALIAQLMLLAQSPQRASLTLITLGGLIVLPPAFSLVNYTNFDGTAWIWLFSIFPSVGLSAPAIAPLTVISCCIMQWIGVTSLALQLQRRIQAMGKSQLLTAS